MSGLEGVSAFPEGDNMFKWVGTIKGPSKTVNHFLILSKQSAQFFFKFWFESLLFYVNIILRFMMV